MANLIAAIRELQVGQQMIKAELEATRAEQKEVAAIRAGQEKIRAAISALRSALADLDANFSKRVERIQASIDRRIHFIGEELSKHSTCIKGLTKIRLENALSEETKLGPETKLEEVEDRVCREDSGKPAICEDSDKEPKGPLSPGTEPLVSLQREDTVHLTRDSRQGCTQEDFPEVDRPRPEKRLEYTKNEEFVTSVPPSHYLITNLKAEGRIGDKSCIVTVDTGAAMTVARPDIVDGLPERDPLMKCSVRTVSGHILPIIKEVLVKLIMGRRPFIKWVCVANIKEEFILGLDVMYAHDAIVDLRRRVLRMGDDEVPLQRPWVSPSSTPYTMGNSKVAADRCAGVKAKPLDPWKKWAASMLRVAKSSSKSELAIRS
jgi:hypothetical protein